MFFASGAIAVQASVSSAVGGGMTNRIGNMPPKHVQKSGHRQRRIRLRVGQPWALAPHAPGGASPPRHRGRFCQIRPLGENRPLRFSSDHCAEQNRPPRLKSGHYPGASSFGAPPLPRPGPPSGREALPPGARGRPHQGPGRGLRVRACESLPRGAPGGPRAPLASGAPSGAPSFCASLPPHLVLAL